MILDITVVILTYNEELHIRRCLENVNQFAKEVFVIDCFSSDDTVKIAKELYAKVVQHQWPGNQSEQFNWGLDNLPITTEWILRLDADEYVTPELVNEMYVKMPHIDHTISAIVLPLGRAFMGRVLKYGIVNNISMIRLFRKGRVRYEQRLMDEHLLVLSGQTMTFQNKFIDDNRNSIKYFIDKHNNYSSREAALLLDAEFHLINYTEQDCASEYCREVLQKRSQKEKYARMPLFWRAFGYFIYRYIVKLGFLDGKEGFLWDFLQGWWYRTLVDAKIYEVKKQCGTDKNKILIALKEKFNISLS